MEDLLGPIGGRGVVFEKPAGLAAGVWEGLVQDARARTYAAMCSWGRHPRWERA